MHGEADLAVGDDGRVHVVGRDGGVRLAAVGREGDRRELPVEG